MSRDGLKKVYLIKSAGYEFAQIDIAQNTLLLGESGVGKTTLMRAVLFFYTMDYSDSVLNLTSETKKSFNEWYFKEYNSHIVYEYTRAENRYLFVVSKSAKLHYTFIDITSEQKGVKEIFIEQNMPLNFEMLQEKIQKESLVSYTTTIKDRYINLLHKRDEYGKRIKTESPVEFYLFEDIKSRKEFARTLSNIFASSSIRSTNMKKTIVSLIDNSSAHIALGDIRLNLNKFALEKKEIEKFEKKIPIIQELAQEYATYQQNKREFKEMANRVAFIHKDALYKKEEIAQQLTESITQKEQHKQKFLLKREMIEEELSNKKMQKALKEATLEELLSKEKMFKKKGIESLVVEYKKEKSYKEEKSSLEARYEILTSGVKEIEQRYSSLLVTLEQNFQNAQMKLQQELSNKQLKANEEINLLVEQKERKITQATASYISEKLELEAKEREYHQEFSMLRQKQGEMKHFVFNKDKIEEYESRIKSYQQKLLEIKSSLMDNAKEREDVEKEIAQIKSTLVNEQQQLEQKYTQAKEQLLVKKAQIEQKLDFDSPNLYGYLSRNDVKNREKIVTYLKDEILFSQREFRVKSITDVESIFGLEVEFEEEFESEYEQEELLKMLKTLKSELKELNKQTQKQRYKVEDSAAKEIKEKNRQRSALYKAKEDLEATQNSYIKNVESAKLALNELQKEATQLKEQEIEKLNTLVLSLEREREKVVSRVAFITQKIDEITLSINHLTSKGIEEKKEGIKRVQQEYKEELVRLQSKFDEQKQHSLAEKLEALKEKGVDKKVLETLHQQKEQLEHKLQAIESSRKLVYSYLEIEPKLGQIPSFQAQIEQLVEEGEAILKRLEFLTKEFEAEQSVDEKAIKQLQQIELNLNHFLKKYDQRVKGTPVEQKMNNLVTLSFSISTDEVDGDEIDQLLAIYEAIKTNEAEIKSFVLRALKDLKFDNIFKLSIPTDFIEDIEYTKTAKELVEYIQKDKLTPLKDALSEQFKGEIRKIGKELDIFEEALLDIYAQIRALANTMRRAVESFNVIDSIEIRAEETNNNLLSTLKSLANYYEKHSEQFLSGLFDASQPEIKRVKVALESKIVELVELLNTSKESLELEDGFVLEFKIVEKGNNLKWRQNIDDIGSNGTSTLVKSVINISMLQMVSKNIVKDREMLTHCVLDEIGTISSDYFRELKEFVNRSGFVFLNGMPIEDDMLISMYPTIYIGQNHNNYSKMVLASKMEL